MWRIAGAVLILGGTLLAWAVTSAWIDEKLRVDSTRRATSSRTRTLLSLLRNAVTAVLFVFGAVATLAELGVNVAPLLAGAGVIGLAIGFGAQKLVQDIINGVFIQLENAINEGDVVTVAGMTGSVETLTIRSVGIRDVSGVFHLIPFSAVDTVSNFMRGFAYHVETVGVAYESDLASVRAAMEDAFTAVQSSPLGSGIIGDTSQIDTMLALAKDAAETSVARTPALLTANFHVSYDDERLINLGFWSEEAAFRALAADPPFQNQYWIDFADNEPGFYRRTFVV